MKSLWNDHEAPSLENPVALRVYTSRLLGQEAALVPHGGGNTSVKQRVPNFFGEIEDLLYIKGSGWDLATIEAAGFAPVKMDALLKLAAMDGLTDAVIAREQRLAMTDPTAPNPSVEAILHALIPFKYVDHTHADAVVALTNTPNGEKIIREIYGDRVLVIPYVMPGFILARKVYEMTRGIDWSQYEGMILLHHGVFTFNDDAKQSYENMIKLVTEAENYLESKGALNSVATAEKGEISWLDLSRLRKAVSMAAGKAMIGKMDTRPMAVGFASLKNVAEMATRAPLTPDHVIRTKRIPMILQDDIEAAVQNYSENYVAYFERHSNGNLTMLDPAPRWVIWQDQGSITFGETVKTAKIAADIVDHTMQAIHWAEAFGGWRPLSEKDIFDVEYWELEQAKLKQNAVAPVFQGKVALVTGAASGIGRACAEMLHDQGAAVIALDIQASIVDQYNRSDFKGVVCDVTDQAALTKAVETAVREFGGLDIVISNAGIFPPSAKIADMSAEMWDRSLAINLTSQQRLLQACIPYLKNGIDPAVVVIGSKNVPAPGPGASAYSVAKAGLTQLVRVAALELAGDGIRVNIVHPDAVFDTGLWTPDILAKRAEHYKMSVHEYKTKNLLGIEIRSKDVAALVCAVAGSAFSRTTGAQIPIDGGNDRVI